MRQRISILFVAVLVMMVGFFSLKTEASDLTYVYKSNVEVPVYAAMDVNSKVMTRNVKDSIVFAQELTAGWLYVEQQNGYIEAKYMTRQKGLYYLVNTDETTIIYSQPSRNSKIIANAFAQSIVVKFNDVAGGWSAVNYGGDYGYVPTKVLKQPKSSAVTVKNKAGTALRKVASPSAKIVATIPANTNLKVYTSFKGWSYVANDTYSGYVKTSDVVAPKPILVPPSKPIPSATKKIALTFDDGPNSKVTPQVLATLKKYNVKATFFVLGQQVQQYPKLAKQIVNEGHQIANHSWNHSDLSKMPIASVKVDLNRTNAIIEKTTGVSPKIYRPPYGAINATMRKNIALTPVLWSVDTLDWQHRNPAKTLAYVKSGARNGGIVLMHDIHQQTANALENVIIYLQKQGYTFVTMDEL